MKFRVRIDLSDGNAVDAKVEAESQAHALERIWDTPEFWRFAAAAQIESVTVEPCGDADEAPDFVLQPSRRDGWWVLTDRRSTLCALFKGGAYNDTVKVTPLDDGAALQKTAAETATVMRQMADYLLEHHPDLL